MNLYEATKDLHHGAEVHPYGVRMATGTLTPQEWTDWLGAMLVIHAALDPCLPPYLQRGGTLLMDLCRMLPLEPAPSQAAKNYTYHLDSATALGGAAYILCGANFRGGAVIRKRLMPKGFPCEHLLFTEPKLANDWITALRDCAGLATEARVAFRVILGVMEEIDSRRGELYGR